jgi:5-(carboxyamino)imidazole ribonucleotide mutase
MNIRVGIIMGSDSDLDVMQESAKVLDEFGVGYELTIISAHRAPDILAAYAKKASRRGLKVIIAGAGGAAHLAGITAALTVLPVIGVPMETRALGGIDSLYSIVQMPAGVPVATVAINGAKNAGLLAIQILALTNKKLTEKLVAYKKGLALGVAEKAKRLEHVGYKKYLAEKERKTA